MAKLLGVDRALLMLLSGVWPEHMGLLFRELLASQRRGHWRWEVYWLRRRGFCSDSYCSLKSLSLEKHISFPSPRS